MIKKVLDDPIKEEQLVYMYLARKQQHKLSLKWFGPCKVITNQHPLYKNGYQSSKGNVEKWIICDKLSRCEKSTTYQDLIYSDKPMETKQRESEILRTTIFEDMNPELRDRDNDINIEGDAPQNLEIQRDLNEEPPSNREVNDNLSRTYNL